MMRKIVYIFSIILLLSFRLVYAQNFFSTVLDQTNSSFFAGITVMHLDYKGGLIQVAPPESVRIEDSGLVYGLSIIFRNVFVERIYGEIAGEYSGGRMEHEEAGTEILNKRVPQHVFNLDAKLGLILLNGEYFQLIPYGGFGYRYWKDSAISSRSDYKAVVGGKVNLSLFDRFALSPYFQFGKMLGSRVELNEIKFNPGDRGVREFGLELNYRWDNEILVSAIVSHNHFESGRSQEVRGVIIPENKTNELKFVLGIRFGFR